MNLMFGSGRSALWVALLLMLSLKSHASALESQVSAKDYAQTVVALRETINSTDAKIFQEVDHRNNAVGKGAELPSSRVFIFGNPKVDTSLMECAPMAAADLPMHMLVRKDEDGRTRLYWTKATELIGRHSDNLSKECQELALKLNVTLEEIARQAATEQ